MNIAIFTPSQNPYSETFIQAHKIYLKGKVCYYYGNGEGIRLEGQGVLISTYKHLALKVKAKLLKQPSSTVRDVMIIASLKAQRIEVILVEYGSHAFSLLPALKQSGLPVVVHFHGYDASMQHVIERCHRYKTVFETVAKVVCVSKKMEQMLLVLGCPKDKLVYNVYGPQPEFLNVKPQFSKKQFVAIGRFTDKKAPYYTILAFKGVLQSHPEAQLVMAGDGVLRNTCENLVKHYGLENNVCFLGVISPERYRDLLSESLAFVQHSITASSGDMEGTPLSILEASAAGLPVIATYHAGIPDVIIHEETGLLCNEHDVTKMSEHMLRVLEDVDFAKRLGRDGKAHIHSYFSLERHIDALQEVLEEAVFENKR